MTNFSRQIIRRALTTTTTTKSKPTPGRVVRETKSSTAPFEGQWTSATERHRTARKEETGEETTVERRPRAVLDAEGFSQAHQQSATNLHRNKNHRHSSVDSGSLAASMSATNQHRRQRQAAAASSRPGNYVNPSEVSLPVEDNEAAVSMKETPPPSEPSASEEKSSLGYIAAAVVAGLAALGGSGILS